MSIGMLGQKLKELRESQNLGQEEAAELLGIDKTSLCRYEKDEVKSPSIDMLEKFKTLYNISSEFFFYDTPLATQKLLDSEIDLFYKFVCLSKEDRDFHRNRICLDYDKAVYTKANRPFKEMFGRKKK